jgi:hypothetical protein
MGIQEGPGPELDDATIDSLLEGGSESRDIPMTAEAPAPQSAWDKDTLKVNGKEITATREEILKWASMGHNAPNLMNEWKAKESAWTKQQQDIQAKEAQLKEIESKWSPYKEVDEYASKNPDWWKQVQENYKQHIQSAETNPEIAALKQELAEIKRFKDEIINEKKSEQLSKEDQQLSSEVESIRKQFTNLDFDTPDESGKSLEMKVLEHAVNNDIKSFKVAFRDFYHDHLLSKAREEGKELVSKEVQKQSKLGILNVTSKPTKGIQLAQNVKDKSYNDLEREALEELRSGTL